ncbi:hypothetical protein GHT06_015917 [Daphnia sinensis]|uniref:Uncharacterized protein n=1 Tax=Daphnia sinensis TaxID=1820382 RepID=A0AAD5LJZ9_9CRUS|nr:hypothetical protein GHT06_015917 [Daphnia sinensis]
MHCSGFGYFPLRWLLEVPLDRLINNNGFSLRPCYLGSRNHSAARMPVTDGNTTKTQQRPCPAIGEAGATLNPGWHPTDSGGRVCNNPSNYANRRRSPSPSVRKSPAISHQPTNLTMGITHQHRPNNFSSARSTYHAGCQHTSQSRIPVYQRNQSFDTVHSPTALIFIFSCYIAFFFSPFIMDFYSFNFFFVAFSHTFVYTAPTTTTT